MDLHVRMQFGKLQVVFCCVGNVSSHVEENSKSVRSVEAFVDIFGGKSAVEDNPFLLCWWAIVKTNFFEEEEARADTRHGEEF